MACLGSKLWRRIEQPPLDSQPRKFHLVEARVCPHTRPRSLIRDLVPFLAARDLDFELETLIANKDGGRARVHLRTDLDKGAILGVKSDRMRQRSVG